MDSIHSAYDQHAFVFWLVLFVLVAIGGIWLLRIQTAIGRVSNRFDDVLEGVSGDNALRMLTEYLGTVRSTAAEVRHMQAEHQRIVRTMPSVVRHVGLVRFSPFHDTGGDQSFALAILDSQRNGVILTGLHSRSDSRLYAKPIEGGASAYSLTPEEMDAMNRAIQGVPVEAPR